MRVTPECNVLNSFVLCAAEGIQMDAAAVFDGEKYIVVWSDERFLDHYHRVVTTRVTTEGAVLDTGICIGKDGEFKREEYPDIAFDGNRCLAVWSYYFAPNGIYGRFINTSGQPEDTVITIASATVGLHTDVRAAFDGDNYLVIFNDDQTIYGQFVSPQGNLIGNKITIANNAFFSTPEIVWDGNTYVVVWRRDISNSVVMGQRVNANGDLVGPNFQISVSSTGAKNDPAFDFSTSNYLVVWEQTSDIYGNLDLTFGIHEASDISFDDHKLPTIVSYDIPLPENKRCRVFDIAGRGVDFNRLTRGIYFLQIDGQIVKKIIKVR